MYIILAAFTVCMMSLMTMVAMIQQQMGIAGLILGIGTYIVFTFGRLHGLKEIK